jgi:hypothetical protein
VQIELPKGYTVGVQSEERRFAFPDGRQQRVVADMFLQKQLSRKWKLDAGLWLFEIAMPQDPLAALQGQVKEMRPYFAVNRSWPFAKANFRLRLQTEYRLFRALNASSFFKGPAQSRRIRNRLLVEYTRKLSARSKIILFEELHLTVAATEKRELFQQNRLGITYQYTLNRSFTTALGYIFWYQPTGLPNEYFARQIVSLQLNYSFRLD